MPRTDSPRRSVPIVHPDRTPGGGATFLTFALALVSLAGFTASLFLLGGVQGPLPTLDDLAAFHLLATGVLVPVALAAAVQLGTAVLAKPGGGSHVWAWCLPLAWLSGVLISFTLYQPGPLLPYAGAVLTGSAVIILLGISRWLVRGEPSTADFRLGLGLGLSGLLATLAVGAGVAFGFAGLWSAAPSAQTHLGLAGTAAFLPLLEGVSGQLFPMFAKALPPEQGKWRRALLILTAVGSTITVGSVAFGTGPWQTVGLAAVAAGTSAWTLQEENLFRTARAVRPDPAASGARIFAPTIAFSAWLATLASIGVPSDRGALMSFAVTLGLVGGITGSVFSYLRRIFPFVSWHWLFRTYGPSAALPKLDQLRPALGVAVAPAVWLAGSLCAALGAAEAAGLSWRCPAIVEGHLLWPLALSGMVMLLELGWAPAKVGAWYWRHRELPRRTAAPSRPR